MKTKNFKFRLLLVIAFVSVSFSSNVFGQVPEKMSYQAVVRNGSNELIVNKEIGVQILITQGIFPPVTVYSETHIATTNSNGLLTLQLGGGKLVSGNFSTIKWENGNVSVSANYDLSGGTNYTLLSSSQLLSVPYALYAKTAGNATGGTTCPDGTTVGEIKYWDGTSWITVAPSLDGMSLTLVNGIPVWTRKGLATLITIGASNPLADVIATGGNIISDGGSPILGRGICWSSSPNPTVPEGATSTETSIGIFYFDFRDTGKIYIRAWARNSYGIAYGNEVSITIY